MKIRTLIRIVVIFILINIILTVITPANAVTPQTKLSALTNQLLDEIDFAVKNIAKIDIDAGSNHTCPLTINGGVKCWENNGAGNLGDGTTENRLTPVDVSSLTIEVGRYCA